MYYIVYHSHLSQPCTQTLQPTRPCTAPYANLNVYCPVHRLHLVEFGTPTLQPTTPCTAPKPNYMTTACTDLNTGYIVYSHQRRLQLCIPSITMYTVYTTTPCMPVHNYTVLLDYSCRVMYTYYTPDYTIKPCTALYTYYEITALYIFYILYHSDCSLVHELYCPLQHFTPTTQLYGVQPSTQTTPSKADYTM